MNGVLETNIQDESKTIDIVSEIDIISTDAAVSASKYRRRIPADNYGVRNGVAD